MRKIKICSTRTAKMTAILLILFCFLYFPFVHYLEPHQAGIGWNLMTGELWLTTKGGWYLSPPWTLVSRIDTRPQRVCVTSATRAVNCRLVEFETQYFREFVVTEGFRYYWFSNRISFNFGYEEEYRGWRDILRGYAFSIKKYQFISVIQEYQ